MERAFEASYLSADAVARSVEQIMTLSQGPNESVTRLSSRREAWRPPPCGDRHPSRHEDGRVTDSFGP